MKKAMIALLLCASLVLGAETTSAAAMQPGFGIAQPMAQECGNCGKMSLFNHYTYGEWLFAYYEICSISSSQQDLVYRRTKYTYARCSGCGYQNLLSTTIEFKTVCTH